MAKDALFIAEYFASEPILETSRKQSEDKAFETRGVGDTEEQNQVGT